jgi:hypothetical protein
VGLDVLEAKRAHIELWRCAMEGRGLAASTITIYDRRRENFDRHAAYVVVAFVAGG